MKNVATISFKEAQTGEECLVIVRAAPGIVALGLSRLHDGDMEIVLGTEALEEVMAALRRAASVSTPAPDGGAA